jgi:uncharacterized protein (TIGR04255 family)
VPNQPERREYAHPPIAEGIAQINFVRPLKWSVATPGLLWERLRDDYPADPEAQDQIAASVQVGDASAGPNVAINRVEQRFLYRDAGRNRLVVANRASLSANSLPPYEGWPNLRARFESAISALSETVPLEPVERVSLRYINRIALPGGRLDTDDYFNLDIRTANEGRASFRSFIHRVESVLEDGATLVISTFATMQPSEEESPFLFDLDVQRNGLNSTNVEEILQIADELKVIENREFESAIKDKTRELFQ